MFKCKVNIDPKEVNILPFVLAKLGIEYRHSKGNTPDENDCSRETVEAVTAVPENAGETRAGNQNPACRLSGLRTGGKKWYE